jgi:hypothetical protein
MGSSGFYEKTGVFLIAGGAFSLQSLNAFLPPKLPPLSLGNAQIQPSLGPSPQVPSPRGHLLAEGQSHRELCHLPLGFLHPSLPQIFATQILFFPRSQASTLTPFINAEGVVAFDTDDGEMTGTRSGSQTTSDMRSVYELHSVTVATSGNGYSVRDSG